MQRRSKVVIGRLSVGLVAERMPPGIERADRAGGLAPVLSVGEPPRWCAAPYAAALRKRGAPDEGIIDVAFVHRCVDVEVYVSLASSDLWYGPTRSSGIASCYNGAGGVEAACVTAMAATAA